jgi:hypothetical protein
MPLIPPISQSPLPPQGDETLLGKPTLVQSLPFTAYDVEDLSPLGTNNNPLDAPKQGTKSFNFQPKWSPSSTYLASTEGAIASPVSSAEKNNFKTSALDLEDELAGINPPPGSNQGVSGGPNRTNSVRINSGQYTVKRAGGMGFSGNDVGGSVVTQTLHRYTPTNGYYDTLIGKPLQTLPKDGTNIALPNNADGPYDDTLK